jgi:uncharacterized membrane protein
VKFTWSTLWLILHILVAIAAFGPAFAYGLISTQARNPQEGAFAGRVIMTIEKRMAIPLTIVLPFLGLALIVTKRYDLWESEWLLISIPIYIVTFLYATFVQDRMGARMLQIGEAFAASGGTEPPAELAVLQKRLQIGGALLGISVMAVLVLMVWRPGAAFLPPP